MGDETESPPQPTWEGDFDEEGLPNGEGKLTYPPPANEGEEEVPGDSYEGPMVHGVREGKGKYTWSSGCSYTGDYKENKKSGQGVLTLPDGGRYEGSFEEDAFSGEGMYAYPSGDVYKGGWKDGKKHGDGSYYCKKHQCQFVGVWSDGAFQTGKWLFSDGSMFEGDFKNKQPAGSGVFKFTSSGLCQKGEYVNGSWRGGETFSMAS